MNNIEKLEKSLSFHTEMGNISMVNTLKSLLIKKIKDLLLFNMDMGNKGMTSILTNKLNKLK
jgi:hypothetical protein